MDSRPVSMLVGMAEMTAWHGGVCVHVFMGGMMTVVMNRQRFSRKLNRHT